MSIGTAKWQRLQRSATAKLGINRFLNRFDGCSARNANKYDTRLGFDRTQKKHAPRHHHQRHLPQPQPQPKSAQQPSLWSSVISAYQLSQHHCGHSVRVIPAMSATRSHKLTNALNTSPIETTTTPRIGLMRPYWMQASCCTAHLTSLMRSASLRLHNVTSSTRHRSQWSFWVTPAKTCPQVVA